MGDRDPELGVPIRATSEPVFIHLGAIAHVMAEIVSLSSMSLGVAICIAEDDILRTLVINIFSYPILFALQQPIPFFLFPTACVPPREPV